MITVCPITSKIFEHCISNHISSLETSDRQLGFRKKFGRSESSHSVRKIVRFFNKRKSTVNLGFVDLQKAFDKTDVYGILIMPQRKNVNRNILNFRENWFLKTYTSIKWNKCLSDKVKLLSGVKQGCILSPLLFNLYVDTVLL